MNAKYDEIVSNVDFDLKRFDVSKIWIEVLSNGSCNREIGFSMSGDIIHRFPGDGKYGRYGIFDAATFDFESMHNNISYEEFERLWNRDQIP